MSISCVACAKDW
ncbi:hypothetical protein YPPY64_2014, partial [Yersinia pestis PY-64]